MKPAREHATNNSQTYFVTSDTWERRALFRTETWARLFFKVLLSHRPDSYLLHEFVLMPDHFHLLVTPQIALERAVQLIKGGFSFRAKKELGSNAEVWQRGFSDHRIRDFEDYERHVHYVRLNPVKKHLCVRPEDYRYSSAYPGWRLDPIPQGLKPGFIAGSGGTAEAMPFQSESQTIDIDEGVPWQGKVQSIGTAEAVAPEDRGSDPQLDPIPQGLKPGGLGAAIGTAEAVPFQNRGSDLELDCIPQGLKPGGLGAGIGTAEAVPFQSNSESKEQRAIQENA